MAQDKGLLFFYDWQPAFETLSGEDCKALLIAMLDYRRDGTPPPEFEGMAKVAASFVFPAIERSAKLAEAGRNGAKKKQEYTESRRVAEPSPHSTLEAPLQPPSSQPQAQDRDKTKNRDKTKQDDDYVVKAEPPSAVAAEQEEMIFGAYNESCPSLKKADKLTGKRREAIRELLGTYTPDEIVEGFRRAQNTPFLCGGGKNGWIADFDWLIQEEHFTRLMEGGYDERQKNKGRQEDDFLAYLNDELAKEETGY